VEGDIHACGVGTRRRVLAGAAREAENAQAMKNELKRDMELKIDVSHESEADRRFFWTTQIRLAREHGFENIANEWEGNLARSVDAWLKSL
jgi:hypothetical protein